MFSKKNDSLKKGFLINFLLFSTIPLIIVSLIISFVISNSIIKNGYRDNYRLTKILKYETEYFLESSIIKARSLSALIENKIIDEKIINDFINFFIKNEIIFKSIKIANNDGIIKFTAPYKPDLIGNNISTSFLKNLDNNIQWTNTFLSNIDYSPNVTLGFRGKDFIYISELNLSYLLNFIENINVEKNSYAFIIDRDNTFIAHSDIKNVKLRNSLEYKIKRGYSSEWNGCFVMIDDKEYLLNLEIINSTNWYVGIIKPKSELYKSIFKSGIIIIIGTLISFGLALIFSILRVRTILKPIEILTQNSNEISKGNYDIKFTESDYKEVNELSKSFTIMIDVVKNREEQLKKNEKEIKDLFNHLPIAVAIFTQDGKIIFFNIKFKELFDPNHINLSMDEWLEIFYNHNTYKEYILKLILENIDKSSKNLFYTIETQKIKALNNEEKVIDIIFCFFNNNLILNFIDITEKYVLTEKLKSSLNEKELYLKEIHHRVKNNLQIITALLNLQKRKLTDDELINIFSETQNRVLSMAIVHEELYRSTDLGKINLKNFINTIVNKIFRNYQLNKPILYKNILSDILITIDIAIPLGLIINEIVSNSLKYAFNQMNHGEINIKLEQKENSIILNIFDNGCGLPENFDIEKTDSLGMSLIYNLTKQINGKLELINKDGVKYIITIPI